MEGGLGQPDQGLAPADLPSSAGMGNDLVSV